MISGKETEGRRLRISDVACEVREQFAALIVTQLSPVKRA